eukprot:534707_1
MGVGDATPDGTGVATAGGSGVPADATLLLVSVVHVGNALAGVEAGVLLGVDVVDAHEGGVVALGGETAAEASEGTLHVEAGALASALHVEALVLELGDLLGAVGVNLGGGRARGVDHLARRLLVFRNK